MLRRVGVHWRSSAAQRSSLTRRGAAPRRAASTRLPPSSSLRGPRANPFGPRVRSLAYLVGGDVSVGCCRAREPVVGGWERGCEEKTRSLLPIGLARSRG